MLRHDMATRMKSSQQFDMKDIQEQLGHSTIQVTMDIYTHIDAERKKQVSNWLEDGMDKLLNRSPDSTTHKTI
jgi:integrase